MLISSRVFIKTGFVMVPKIVQMDLMKRLIIAKILLVDLISSSARIGPASLDICIVRDMLIVQMDRMRKTVVPLFQNVILKLNLIVVVINVYQMLKCVTVDRTVQTGRMNLKINVGSTNVSKATVVVHISVSTHRHPFIVIVTTVIS